MKYFCIMFQVEPTPLGAPGPIMIQIKEESYNRIIRNEKATIIGGHGKFIVNKHESIVLEDYRCTILVCKVFKINQ